MGALIAIAIIWWFIGRSETKETRKQQRKIGGAVFLGSLLWFLEGVWNADKHQKY